MFAYERIYNILKTTTPTNGELTEMIYGYDDGDPNGYRQNIRGYLTDLRRRYKVQITADQNGRYHMVKPQYAYEDNQWNYAGKTGRPRFFA
jgi:hypothetical protein